MISGRNLIEKRMKCGTRKTSKLHWDVYGFHYSAGEDKFKEYQTHRHSKNDCCENSSIRLLHQTSNSKITIARPRVPVCSVNPQLVKRPPFRELRQEPKAYVVCISFASKGCCLSNVWLMRRKKYIHPVHLSPGGRYPIPRPSISLLSRSCQVSPLSSSSSSTPCISTSAGPSLFDFCLVAFLV